VKEPYPRYYEDPSEIPPPIKEYTQKDFSKKQLWEQLLYEGTMEGMGYSKNQEPFLRLARNLSLEFTRQEKGGDEGDSVLNLQAMLFGAAGFLNSKKTYDDAETRGHLASLRKVWRTTRKKYQREVLHEADWQFFRLRPQNFPTVRLAAMSFLLNKLLRRNWVREVIQVVKSQGTTEEKLAGLQTLFSVEANGYWTEHFTFGGQRHQQVRTLIGLERVQEIILNAVIPITLLYARVFKDSAVRRQAIRLYESFPALESNSILKTMRSQLLKKRLPLKTAYLQQGTIQLYKFYCTEKRCRECEIGRVVFDSLSEERTVISRSSSF
jgi:hypothetical protein